MLWLSNKIYNEIKTRLNGEVFYGKIISKEFSFMSYDIHIVYEHESTFEKATISLLLLFSYLFFYRIGDEIKIICYPQKGDVIKAYACGRYSELIYMFAYFPFFCIMLYLHMVILFSGFFPF